jgi:sucrose phosphorylase
MKLNNGVMLITYADSLGNNLSDLLNVLQQYFAGAISGVHILPFFPSSSDRGFSPLCYDIVDPRFGDWNDLLSLSDKYYLMYDFMINHISSRSPFFQDYIVNKDTSKFAEMFIRYKEFWADGEPTQDQLIKIYKRKPRAPYVDTAFNNGTSEKLWCTFGDDQIDINIRSETTWRFIGDNLKYLVSKGAAVIRLDAFAYTIKKAGGSCFFEEPEIWDTLERVKAILSASQVEILPEVHEHYSLQMKLAKKDYWVYDFALPMLVLHSLLTGETSNLVHWLNNCPRKQFTTLDTHDGIGVVDVRGLLTDEQINQTVDLLYSQGANIKKIYSSEIYHNLDIYQINCTYYSALGNRDEAYLVARIIQIFAPGIPQIYYVGLLAGSNDISLVETTKNGRDINRHAYSLEEIEREIQRPLVQKTLNLMRFRNTFMAFSGECEATSNGTILTITRRFNGYTAELKADMRSYVYSIEYSAPDGNIQNLVL